MKPKNDFSTLGGKLWMDGRLINWNDGTVHVLTHGLHYGSAIFEGMRSYGGKVFKMKEHFERFHESARLLGFTLPYSVKELCKATDDVLKANKQKDVYLRPVAWRGSKKMGISNREHDDIRVAIATWDWPSYHDPKTKMQGIRLMIANWRRPSPDCAPSASKAAGLYMICTLSKNGAEEAGFDDALMLDYRGRVAEATASNIFFVKNGELITPECDCFLNGITRQTIIAMGKKMGLTVTERAVWPQELYLMDEVFLCGTAVEIVPVGQIAGVNYTVGPVTQKLMAAYSTLVRK